MSKTNPTAKPATNGTTAKTTPAPEFRLGGKVAIGHGSHRVPNSVVLKRLPAVLRGEQTMKEVGESLRVSNLGVRVKKLLGGRTVRAYAAAFGGDDAKLWADLKGRIEGAQKAETSK